MNRNLGFWIAIVLLFGLYVYWYSANINPTVDIPNPKMPSPNAFDDFNAACDLIRDKDIYNVDASAGATLQQTLSHASLGSPWPTKAEDTKVVADNLPAISRLHYGFMHAFQAPPVRSVKDSPEYNSNYRMMARLLKFEGRLAASHGDWGTTAELNTDTLQMATLVGHGDVLSMLVERALSGIGREDLWATISHLNAAQCRKLSFRMEVIQAQREAFATVMVEEKREDEALLMETFHNPNSAQTLISNINNDSESREVKIPSYLFYCCYPKRVIMDHYATYMDTQVARSTEPFFEIRREPAPQVPADPYCSTELQPIDFSRLMYVSDDAYNQLLMTMLALHAYELDHSGAYPDTLQQLVPRYLHAMPYDPFAANDAPLKYRRTGSEYLLYSVGADGVDDGGKPFVNKDYARSQTRWEEIGTKGDIVAGVNED